MSAYDEARYAIYNRLDKLSRKERDDVVEHLAWFEKVVRQRERSQIIALLRQGHSDVGASLGFRQIADYLEALTHPEQYSKQEEEA